jgi:thioredoxin 1
MATIPLTTENHDATVQDGIVLIDFWAAWCGPCRSFAPIFERASEQHTDVTFAKVDTEDQQELAGRYGITSIPTLVIYRDGVPLFAQPGALPAPALEDLVAQTRALDMDDVRAQYAEQLAGRESGAHEHQH